METGWALVGREVVAAREAKGWLQADLVRASGVSDATVRKMEQGRDQSYRTNIKRAVEAALGWPAGHIDALLKLTPTPAALAEMQEVLRLIDQRPRPITTDDDLLALMDARILELEQQITQQRGLLRKLAIAAEALGLELDEDDYPALDATRDVGGKQEGRR